MTTYASGRPTARKLQAQGGRMFRARMQAARWPQEFSDNKAAAAKTGLGQPVPAPESIKVNQP